MHRRKFLTEMGQLGAAATLTLASAPPHARGQAEIEPLPCSDHTYRRIFPLTESRDFLDARPCFSPDGKHVLFMRQARVPGTNRFDVVELWTVPADGGEARVFLKQRNANFTRPDWSWDRSSFEIAVDAYGTSISPGIYLIDVATKRLKYVLRTQAPRNRIYSYPSWYPGGRSLSITNYWENFNSDTGCSSFQTRQNLVRLELDKGLSLLTHPSTVWPGMSSVSHVAVKGGGHPIAFAGEPPNRVGYCQNDNQIWIRSPRGHVYQIDGFQGRAPWWSPDGQKIAFESNRLTKNENYQIFVQYPWQPRRIEAITCPEYAMQHAKWSPDGSKLVFAYAIPNSNGRNGIAYVELT